LRTNYGLVVEFVKYQLRKTIGVRLAPTKSTKYPPRLGCRPMIKMRCHKPTTQ
jgi:hypothetical protein